MSSICPSKSVFPSRYFAAQENCVNYINRIFMASGLCWIWPVGICSRRWEEGVSSGYLFPWVPPFKASSGQVCSSTKSHCTSRWPTPRDSFQFPLTYPSPYLLGIGVITSLTTGSGSLLYLKGVICFLGH